jgi:CHASE2 domain-containing sensor protein
VPGLLVIAVVMLARWAGGLQYFERTALDTLLRSRPPEATDERVLIIGIDEADIREIGQYPIPDRYLAELLQTLNTYQPAVIGLDIFRDLPVNPGHAQLLQTFRQTPNLIGIEKVLPDESGFTINPPPTLPSEQVGFVDAVLDQDGALRRSLLGVSAPSGEYRFSLTLRLAERYLALQGKMLENGKRDPIAFRWDDTELPRFHPNSGGYVRADAGGNQVLLYFRSGKQPFHRVSLRQLRAGQVPEDWIRDRIVLIGVTALSAGDVVNVAALPNSNPGLNFGVEIQAHAVSQITSAVLDQRPLITVWAEGWEYFWILLWGILGISLGRIFFHPIRLLIGLTMSSLMLFVLCYGFLLLGWWIPFVPALLVLLVNGASLTAILFYRHERELQTRLQERQQVIEQTFDTIHNGPLQTLAGLMRSHQTGKLAADDLSARLEHLNQELRAVYESMRQQVWQTDTAFWLNAELWLDLQLPMHEILYSVYNHTLTRDLPGFQSIKLKLTAFEAIDERRLNADIKQGLCRFLEEALCNVGKHAVSVTQLQVVCRTEQQQNVIRVIDNGVAIATLQNVNQQHQFNQAGRGTQQAKSLARQLRGQFRRSPHSPQGTLCELTWPIVHTKHLP